MKRLIIILSVIIAGVTSCSVNKETEIVDENMPSLESPKILDNDWNKWIVGEWEGTAKSDFREHKDWVEGKGEAKVELGLNGQFLIMKRKAEVTRMSPEYIQYLKETMHIPDDDIGKIYGSVFESLEIYTQDPKSGKIIGYLFDGFRCIAKGAGHWDGNKEIINWEWSVQGRGTSTRITEKVSADKFVTTEKYTLPDGSIMVDRVEMTRKQ
jgi:hypothetical protein